MRRVLFILVAFSILNQSIDLDYITLNFQYARSVVAEFDDVDSITELLIETIMQSDDYTPEDYHDDNGNPQHNVVIKFAWSPLIYHTGERIAVANRDKIADTCPAYLFPVHHTCKGYGNIVSPPPDIMA